MTDTDSLVCYCTGLTLGEIQSAAEKGELHLLYEEGMSQYCGSCTEDVKNILKNFIHNDEDEYYR